MVCVFICMCVCLHVHVCVYMYMCLCMCVYMYVCVYVFECLCITSNLHICAQWTLYHYDIMGRGGVKVSTKWRKYRKTGVNEHVPMFLYKFACILSI